MKLITTILSIVGASALTTTVVVPVAVTQTNKKNDRKQDNNVLSNAFYLQTQNGSLKFNNAKEATDFILGNNVNGLVSGNKFSYQSYIGDFDKSVEPIFNTLNVEGLYEYKRSNIQNAFKSANGGYLADQYAAAKSYLENYRMWYMDANGDLYSSQASAIQANREIASSQQTLGVSYYKIHDYALKKDFNLNPLNYEDINIFKKIMLRNLGNNEYNLVQLFGTENKLVPINSLFFSDNNAYIETSYNLLKLFSEYKNKLKYNFTVNLSRNDHTKTSKTAYIRHKVPGSYGSDYYYLANTDSKKQVTYDKFGYDIYVYDKENKKDVKIEEINFNDLSAIEFNDNAEIFLNAQEFEKNATITPHKWRGELFNNYPYASYITESNGNEYTLNINNNKYIFKINRYDNQKNNYLFGDFLRLMQRENGKETSEFSLHVTTNNNAIDKSELIQKVYDILINDLLLNNSDWEYIYELNNEATLNIYNWTKNEVNKLAKDLVNDFLISISSTQLNYGDSAKNITNDINSYFNDTSYDDMKNKMENLSSFWWISALYQNKTFDKLKTFINNLLPILYNKGDVKQVALTFNDVPVFIIENINEIVGDNIILKNDIINALQKWIYSDDYNESKLINISNQIVYDQRINGFSLSKSYQTITEFDPKSYLPIDFILPNSKYSEKELNNFQHLLLSSVDKPELFMNDSGIDSAFDLYNDNIKKIATLPNAVSYFSKIDEKNKINPNDVLRLYEKTNNLNEYQDHPIPVGYGEMRIQSGYFNPSIAEKKLIFYKSELDSITNYFDPLEVPIVNINGTSYFLAHIANGANSAVLTGNIDELINNAANRIFKYIKPDENFVFYYDEDINNNILVKNDVRQICVMQFNGEYMKELWPNGLFASDIMYFLQYSDLYNYVELFVLRNGQYANNDPFDVVYKER